MEAALHDVALGNREDPSQDWMKALILYEKGDLRGSRLHFRQYNQFQISKGLDPQVLLEWTSQYRLFLGFVDTREGRIDSAKSSLAQVGSLLPSVGAIEKGWITSRFNLLRAEVLLAEDSVDKAIAMCEGMVFPELPYFGPITTPFARHNFPFLRDVLARAYAKKGELEKAIDEYELLIAFDPNGKERHFVHAKYHDRLARLYEQKGWSDRAIKEYRRFLELWKDADKDLPEPKDARKRLARLMTQR
jgi:tetratricopeptide (TPR) repeat protein